MPALVELFRHNLWANQQLLTLCAGLGDEQLDASAPGTYGSVRDTWVHIVANEEGYVVQSGITLPQPLLFQRGRDAEFPGFDDLRARAERSGEGLIKLAGRVRPGQTLRVSWQNRAFEVPAVVLLIQAINHTTEHRGHIVSILSQHGVGPPLIDAWAYFNSVIMARAAGPATGSPPRAGGSPKGRRASSSKRR